MLNWKLGSERTSRWSESLQMKSKISSWRKVYCMFFLYHARKYELLAALACRSEKLKHDLAWAVQSVAFPEMYSCSFWLTCRATGPKGNPGPPGPPGKLFPLFKQAYACLCYEHEKVCVSDAIVVCLFWVSGPMGEGGVGPMGPPGSPGSTGENFSSRICILSLASFCTWCTWKHSLEIF